MAGELDYDTARIWDAGLSEPLAAGGASVAVELSRLTFRDTVGITCLVHAHRRAQESGARIVFLRPSTQMRRLLSITGLIEHLPIHDELPTDDSATT
jgi:anti-sigma B factor antagonist